MKDKKNKLKKYFKAITFNLISTLLATAIISIGATYKGIFTLPSKLEKMEEKFSDLEKKIENLEINDQKRDIEFEVDGTASFKISQNEVISETYYAAPKVEDIEMISEIIKDDQEYMEQGEENQFIPYKKGEKEILFYGQINEKFQCNGKCIINVYKNNSLNLIMEAEYNQGKLLFYRQASIYQDRNGEYIWMFSDRKVDDNFESGEDWHYIQNEEYIKNFDFYKVCEDDLITFDQFNSKVENTLEYYYHGNISDKFYNDNTGEAYLMKNSNDGKVNILYFGNFKDGLFDDSTGRAWCIVKDKNIGYMYYKGAFKDGEIIYDDTSVLKNLVSLEQLNEYIQNYKFKYKPEWADN